MAVLVRNDEMSRAVLSLVELLRYCRPYLQCPDWGWKANLGKGAGVGCGGQGPLLRGTRLTRWQWIREMHRVYSVSSWIANSQEIHSILGR
jgi:hypothetical protein